MSFSVLIADTHDITRLGVQSVVDTTAGHVVGTAGTGLEAISMAEEHEPDLMIMSLRLPHLNGFDVLYHLERCSLDTDVIVLAACDDEERVRSVFEHGAAAYLCKQDSLDELRRALHAVRAGRTYVSDALPDTLAVPRPRGDGAPPATDPALTSRERQVVQLTAEGFTSREIGEALSISHRTVEKHRENIKKKLGAKSVVEVALFAFRRTVLPDVRVLQGRPRPSA
jgi:DNA-binding NarL/FixJ family response regulator